MNWSKKDFLLIKELENFAAERSACCKRDLENYFRL